MQRRTRLWARLWRVALLGLGVTLAFGVQAEDRFEIRRAFVEPVEGVWQLNASLDLSLSRAAREALAEGIPLTLVLDILVTRERRFLCPPDPARPLAEGDVLLVLSS